MTARIIDPSAVAKSFRQAVRERIRTLPQPLKLVGFLSTDYPPSLTYANYTKIGCDDAGIEFEIRHENKHHIEAAIEAANADPKVHGMIVYYPIFTVERDRYIKDVVDHRKDIEGLNSQWVRKLYHDERFIDAAAHKKAILPCTPLAIVKLLEAAGAMGPKPKPLTSRVVCVFNRSEVVGRPLASMLANDGATVYSFDVDGPQLFRQGKIEECTISRADALAQSDVVITGVPSRAFPLVTAKEIRADAVCVNFSTLKNFDEDVLEKASVFIPRVGPMTVAMALRNTLRLYENYHRA